MNHNARAWESEYQNPQFLTLGTEPISDVRDFCSWLKKQARKNPQDFSAPISEWSVLDLGCGNGKNLKYMIEHFAKQGIGYDISKTAIDHAKSLGEGLPIAYEVRSIADLFPLDENSVDLALDVTSSNSLSNAERGKFLSEISRVLKPGGYCFTRALCKDGDDNAKNLIKQFPGPDPDTYVLAETGITERVFSRQDFIDTYSEYFDILSLEKTTGYQRWGNQKYRRNYWLAYLQIKKK